MVNMSNFIILLFVSNAAFVSPRVIGGQSNEKATIDDLKDATSFEELQDMFSNIKAGTNGNDISNKIIGASKRLLTIVIENGKITTEAHAKIINKTSEMIEKLSAGLEGIDEKHKEHAIISAQQILESTIELKHTRNTLNEVVVRVKYTVKNLKALAQSIFNGEITEEDVIDRIIKHQVAIMRDLIKETKEIIDSAKESYGRVRDTFGEVEHRLMQYKEEVRMIVDSNNRDMTKLEREAQLKRASIYTSCTSSTIACGFIDIITLGVCSGINAAVCIPIIASMEVAITTVGPEKKLLFERAKEAYEDAKEIYADQEHLQTYLTKETRTLGNLDAALTSADDNLKLSDTIFKIDIPTIRARYMQSLVELEHAAQQYLDQDELEK